MIRQTCASPEQEGDRQEIDTALIYAEHPPTICVCQSTFQSRTQLVFLHSFEFDQDDVGPDADGWLDDDEADYSSRGPPASL